MKTIAHLEPRHLNSGPLQSFSNKQREEASKCNSAISPACPEPFVFFWLMGLTSQSLTLPTKARPSLLDHFSPLYLLILSSPDTLLSHLQSGGLAHSVSSTQKALPGSFCLLASLLQLFPHLSLQASFLSFTVLPTGVYDHCRDNVHPGISLTNCKLHENKDYVVLLTIWPPVF